MTRSTLSPQQRARLMVAVDEINEQIKLANEAVREKRAIAQLKMRAGRDEEALQALLEYADLVGQTQNLAGQLVGMEHVLVILAQDGELWRA